MSRGKIFGLLIGAAIAISSWSAPVLGEENSDIDFDGVAETGSLTIEGRKPGGPINGGSNGRAPDKPSGKRDAVTDGPRRVWVSASDRDLGCRSGGPDVFRLLAVTSFCRTARAACPVAFPGASVVVGHEVEVSTGAPILGTERVSGCSSPSSSSGGGGSVMPVVSQEDFRSLGVEPLVAHLGPPGEWIPIGLDMVVWAESRVQTFEVEMLGRAVSVRATPVKYIWDFGDGTVLTTLFPGRPFPSKDVSMGYTQCDRCVAKMARPSLLATANYCAVTVPLGCPCMALTRRGRERAAS
ncbi:hypothetical protein HMPREF1484_01529 [Dermabacter sp. HFH0086]|nr:hypothetical protein HMPREF1484_01529 [Dermabacter sp. HFH0086]